MHSIFGFDLFNEKNEVEGATGILYGCYFVLHIMPITSQLGVIFSWELIIKACGGIVLACITTVSLNWAKKWSNQYYDDKISPKWFKKIKKDADTEKEDDEERA